MSIAYIGKCHFTLVEKQLYINRIHDTECHHICKMLSIENDL